MPEKPDFPKPNFDKIAEKIIEEEHQSSQPQKSEDVLTVPVPERHAEDYEKIDVIEEYVYDPKSVHGKSGDMAYYCNEGIDKKRRNEDRVVVMTEQDAFALIDGIGEGDGYNAARILAEEIRTGVIEGAPIETIVQRAQNHMKDIVDGLSLRGGAHFALGQVVDGELHMHSTGDVVIEVYDEEGVLVGQNELDRKDMFNAGPGVGSNELGEIHSKKIPLKQGYRIVARTDGVFDNVPKQFMKDALKGKDLVEVAGAIQQEQLKHMEEAAPLLEANRQAKREKKMNLLEYRRKQDKIYEEIGKPDHATLLIYEIKKPIPPVPYEEPKDTQTRVNIEVPGAEHAEEIIEKKAGAELTREQLDKLEQTADVQDYKEGVYQSWKEQIYDPAMPQSEDEIREGFEAWWKLSKYQEIKFLIAEGQIDNIENV